jgi:hypothetical protein
MENEPATFSESTGQFLRTSFEKHRKFIRRAETRSKSGYNALSGAIFILIQCLNNVDKICPVLLAVYEVLSEISMDSFLSSHLLKL